MSNEDKILLRKTLRYIKIYRKKIYFLLFFLILTIILSMLQPLLVGSIIQNISEQKFEIINNNILLLLFIYILQGGINSFKSYLEIKLNNDIIYNIKKNLYVKILNFKMKEFNNLTIGELISRLEGDVNLIAYSFTNHILNMFINIIKMFIICILIFNINIYMAIFITIIFPFVYYLFLIIGKKIKYQSIQLKKLNDRYFSFIQQTFNNIKYIKSLGMKNQNINKFSQLALNFKFKQIKVSMINVLVKNGIVILNCINTIILIFLGVYSIKNKIISIKNFIVIMSYASQFYQCLTELSEINTIFHQMLVSIERVFSIIDNVDFEEEKFGIITKDSISGKIKFENIFFKYNNKTILENFNLTIREKSITVITGNNGSGKSTIFNLILKLYNPQGGRILVDDLDIENFDEYTLRKNISILDQQPMVFKGSIRENFKYICPSISNIEIESICKKVFIHNYIINLKEGYDTSVSECGKNLSGGQKQLLSLAMCLCKNTKIILLDEPTSALDAKIKELFNKIMIDIGKDKTLLIITHDSSLLEIADNIVSL
ncbi:ABC transporter ATP-binding protein [Clostridium sp. CTA-19]